MKSKEAMKITKLKIRIFANSTETVDKLKKKAGEGYSYKTTPSRNLNNAT